MIHYPGLDFEDLSAAEDFYAKYQASLICSEQETKDAMRFGCLRMNYEGIERLYGLEEKETPTAASAKEI